MAHKKGVGSTDNGRDSNSNRLGVKLFGGQLAIAGNIIIRQRGTKFHAGENVYMGRDHTLHAKVDGIVDFTVGRKNRTFVHILPLEGSSQDIAEQLEEVVETVADTAPKAEETVAAPAEEVKEEAVEEVKAELAEEVKEEVAEEVTEEPKAEKKEGVKFDLTKVEGIGPKISEILNDAGLDSFEALAAKNADEVREILSAAGNRYKRFDPTTWPKQAKMAAEGKWDELKKWQDEMDGGKA